MSHRLLLAIVTVVALGAAPPASAQQLPPPPAGFTWVEAVNGAGSFLRPDGWFTKEEEQGDTHAFFVTKTPIGHGGRFDIGLTVNAFDHVARRGAPPSAWASAMAARLTIGREVLKSTVVKGNAADMHIVRVVDTRGGRPVVIHYLVIGNDAKDRAWLIFFEAPQSDWDATYPIAQPMLNAFGL